MKRITYIVKKDCFVVEHVLEENPYKLNKTHLVHELSVLHHKFGDYIYEDIIGAYRYINNESDVDSEEEILYNDFIDMREEVRNALEGNL